MAIFSNSLAPPVPQSHQETSAPSSTPKSSRTGRTSRQLLQAPSRGPASPLTSPRCRSSWSWTWLWWSPCPGWWSPPLWPPSCRSPTWPWTPEICSREGSCGLWTSRSHSRWSGLRWGRPAGWCCWQEQGELSLTPVHKPDQFLTRSLCISTIVLPISSGGISPCGIGVY